LLAYRVRVLVGESVEEIATGELKGAETRLYEYVALCGGTRATDEAIGCIHMRKPAKAT
jgi:hypothetical protein